MLKNLLGERIYSRFNPITHNFEPYNEETLYQILASRIEHVYGRNIAEDESLQELCSFVAKNGGNIRYLFSLFLDSLQIPQERSLKRVTAACVNEMLSREKANKIQGTIAEISDKKSGKFIVLKAIAELANEDKNPLHSGLIIDRLGKEMSIRNIEYCLRDLESIGLITLERAKLGKGYSQNIKLLVEPRRIPSS